MSGSSNQGCANIDVAGIVASDTGNFIRYPPWLMGRSPALKVSSRI